jgi:hypothetical protein
MESTGEGAGARAATDAIDADAARRVSDALGDVRPGVDHPAMSTTPAAEITPTPATPEKVRPRVNIEDKKLPGNYGWTGRIVEAAQRKWIQFDTWNMTHADVTKSDRKARTAATMELRRNSLTGQRDLCEDQLQKAQERVEELKNNDSLFSKLPIGRQINSLRLRWNMSKAQGLQRDIRVIDAGLVDVNGKWQRALDSKSLYDSRVNARVSKAEQKLNDKLQPVERLRTEVDAAVAKLGDSIAAYEKVRLSLGEKIDALKAERRRGPQTEGQLRARQEKLSLLKRQFADSTKALERHQGKLLRCYDHQQRLANAHSQAKAAKEGILGRYHRRVEAISRPESPAGTPEPTPTTPTSPESTAADTDSLADEIEAGSIEAGDRMKLTPQNFLRHWNIALPGAEIKTGQPVTSFEDIVKLYDKLVPPGTTGALTEEMRRGDPMEIGEWRTLVKKLVEKSPEFKGLLSGERGIDADIAMNKISLMAANRIVEIV